MSSFLLIYPRPDEIKNTRFGFSLNLLYLSSLLKQEKHNVIGYIDFTIKNYSIENLNGYVEKSDYIIVEFDTFHLKRSSNKIQAEEIVKLIKQRYPQKKIIAFGYDLAISPRTIPYADYIFTDKFENNLIKLTKKRNSNLTDYISSNKSFDKLPFPDREIIPKLAQFGGNIAHKPNMERSTLLQTSRGCLNTCIFCQRKGWQNKYIYHSIEYTTSEFEYLSINKYKNVWISDDNFTFNLLRAKKLLRNLIDSGFTIDMKISLSSWTKIDKEFLDLAKKASISIISFGIESANIKILKFYKKDIDLQYTADLIKYADQIGIYTVGNFIIGAPFETDITIKETFNFAINNSFDQVNIKILDYMPGSLLYDKLPEKFKKERNSIFASKENELTNYSLKELKDKIRIFMGKFVDSRKVKIKNKIRNYGAPYKTLKSKNKH